MKDIDTAYILFFIGMMIVGFVLSLPHIIEERKLKKSRLKCKLLRKVHRDYKIYWCHNFDEQFFPHYLVTYKDKNVKIFQVNYYKDYHGNKVRALRSAKHYILQEIRKKYSPTKKKIKIIKVWHI